MTIQEYTCKLLEQIANGISYHSHVIEMQNRQLEQIRYEMRRLNTIVKELNKEDKNHE